jgi:hypothetical protein
VENKSPSTHVPPQSPQFEARDACQEHRKNICDDGLPVNCFQEIDVRCYVADDAFNFIMRLRLGNASAALQSASTPHALLDQAAEVEVAHDLFERPSQRREPYTLALSRRWGRRMSPFDARSRAGPKVVFAQTSPLRTSTGQIADHARPWR